MKTEKNPSGDREDSKQHLEGAKGLSGLEQFMLMQTNHSELA